MLKNKTIKKILCFLVVLTLIMSQFAVTLAADDDAEQEEAAIAAGQKEINAITDFSTYGARDSFEMSEAQYAAAGSFTDVENESLLKKLNFLSETGFIEAPEDGLFRPEDKVTRVELVVTLLKLLNVKVESLSQAYVSFYDVPADYEYFNEINVACSMKLINGFGDNTFKPNDYISSQDLITILIRSLGYGMDAEQHGSYPMGYLYQAHAIGLDSGVELQSANDITRAEAAAIYYNFLHTKVQKQTLYGQMLEYSTNTDVLEEYHDIYSKIGRVIATEYSGVGTTPATREDYINISNKIYKCELPSQFSNLAYEVKYYYYETDDSTEPVVIYMEKTKNNDEKIIQAEDIISYSNNVLTYYSGNRTVTEKIDIAHNLFYNGVLISDYDDSTFVPKTGYIKLVKDIASENYKYVFVQSFFNYFVSGLSLDDTELLFETPNSVDMIRIDLEKIKWELYDKNGKLTTGIGVTDTFNADGLKIKQYSLPPIPANSLISVFTDKPVYKNGHYSIGSDATYVKIFMNSETITGKVSSISEDNSGKIDSLVVDTTNYDVSSDHYLAEKGKAIKVSQLAAFYLDFDGKLAAYTVEEDSGNYVYAYLVNAFLRNGLRKSIDIKLLHTDNTFKVYSVSGSININDKKYTDLKLAYAELQKSAKLIVSTFTISQLVKVKINSNDEITNIQTVRQIGSALDPNNPDELVCNEAGQPFTTIKYGGATLVRTDAPILNKSGTITKGRVSLYGPPKVVFLVPSAETFDENDYEITTSYADATLDVFDINDGLTPAAAVNYGEVTDSKFDVPYIFVTEVFQSINEEGAVVDGVKGYTGFGEIKYYADKQGLFSDVKKGDIISVAGDKSAKIIKSYSHVFSVYDVLNVDYSLPMQPVTSLGSNLRAFMYENYYYTASNRMLVLQTGAEGDNNKREYQRVFHWTTVSNVLKYGLLTCTIDDDDNFTLKTSGPTDLHPAVNYGHEYSSKILIFESSDSIIKYMLIVNKK